MDFALVDETKSILLAISNSNNINGDPVEVIVYTNTSGSTKLNLVIEKYTPVGGPDPSLMKYVGFSNITINEYDTDSSTVVGHANALSAISVGGAHYQQTPAFGITPPLQESSSSAGGTSTLFDTSGSPVSIVRNKPNIIAPDGTDTTFFGYDSDANGFPNFFGTSAAAPHAAAAAALMIEHDAANTPATILSLMESTAVDMDAAGFDYNTGHGLIDIQAVLVASTPPSATTLVTPDGAVADNTPIYTWNAVSSATEYLLWVDQGASNKIATWYTAAEAGCDSGSGTCSVTPTTILALGSYTWRVQTSNGAGYGPWSAEKTFNVTTESGLPSAATLISPEGAITDITPTYTWNAVSDSTWYLLWVNQGASNKIGTWYTAAEVGCGSGSGTCSITPTTVLGNGNHTWWIRTYNDVGNGPWSTEKTFSVSGSPLP
jgi:hypothetical protein